MGGDLGPEVVAEGAAWLSQEPVDIHVQLVGGRAAIEAALSTLRFGPRRLSVVSADGHMAQSDDPRLVRERPDCSVCRAVRLVTDGDADAVVSAGNTGALILASSQYMPRIPGIRRAALAAVHPTAKRHGPRRDPFALILDVRATAAADAQSLVGFAALGSAYSSIVSEIERLRVALPSNVSDDKTGTPPIAEAHRDPKGGRFNSLGIVW